MRTRWKHLRPIKSRLLVRVGAAIHGHPILAGGHAIIRHLLIAHRVGNIVAVGLRCRHCRHISPVLIAPVLHSIQVTRSRELVLIAGHVVHAVRYWYHAKRMHHAISRHIVQPVKMVQVAFIAKTSRLLCLGVLLDMGLRVRQMTGPGGISASDRTLLEVTLENVASGESVAAENTHIWPVSSV